jgi:hypothetical protein
MRHLPFISLLLALISACTSPAPAPERGLNVDSLGVVLDARTTAIRTRLDGQAHLRDSLATSLAALRQEMDSLAAARIRMRDVPAPSKAKPK